MYRIRSSLMFSVFFVTCFVLVEVRVNFSSQSAISKVQKHNYGLNGDNSVLSSAFVGSFDGMGKIYVTKGNAKRQMTCFDFLSWPDAAERLHKNLQKITFQLLM